MAFGRKSAVRVLSIVEQYCSRVYDEFPVMTTGLPCTSQFSTLLSCSASASRAQDRSLGTQGECKQVDASIDVRPSRQSPACKHKLPFSSRVVKYDPAMSGLLDNRCTRCVSYPVRHVPGAQKRLTSRGQRTPGGRTPAQPRRSASRPGRPPRHRPRCAWRTTRLSVDKGGGCPGR